MKSFLIVIVSAFLLAGCGGESGEQDAAPGKRSVYVGALVGAGVAVAMVEQGGTLSLYFCGSGEALTYHTRWFSGALEDDRIDLSEDGWSLTGKIDEGEVIGALTDEEGGLFEYALTLAAPGSKSELYSVVDAGCRAGVIVSDWGEGEAPHVQGAWCDGQGLVKQVTPMTPLDEVVEGLQVSVELDAGPHQFTVQPHQVSN
jgi:hypothetical protein